MTSIAFHRGRPVRSPLALLRRLSVAAAALLTAFAVGPATLADTKPQPVPAAKQGLVTPDEMAMGALLLKTTEAGKFLEAPRLKTDVDITVTGPIVRARITQRFENPSDKWVEGVYVYPLPQNSGVEPAPHSTAVIHKFHAIDEITDIAKLGDQLHPVRDIEANPPEIDHVAASTKMRCLLD